MKLSILSRRIVNNKEIVEVVIGVHRGSKVGRAEHFESYEEVDNEEEDHGGDVHEGEDTLPVNLEKQISVLRECFQRKVVLSPVDHFYLFNWTRKN